LAGLLDFERMQVDRSRRVSDTLEERETDLLVQVPWSDPELAVRHPTWLHIITEHQSAPSASCSTGRRDIGKRSGTELIWRGNNKRSRVRRSNCRWWSPK
jgi:hypothetical protein